MYVAALLLFVHQLCSFKVSTLLLGATSTSILRLLPLLSSLMARPISSSKFGVVKSLYTLPDAPRIRPVASEAVAPGTTPAMDLPPPPPVVVVENQKYAQKRRYIQVVVLIHTPASLELRLSLLSLLVSTTTKMPKFPTSTVPSLMQKR